MEGMEGKRRERGFARSRDELCDSWGEKTVAVGMGGGRGQTGRGGTRGQTEQGVAGGQKSGVLLTLYVEPPRLTRKK